VSGTVSPRRSRRICRARTSASLVGTALPSCRCTAVRVSVILYSSGVVWSRQSSRGARRLLSQGKGPVPGPGCAKHLHQALRRGVPAPRIPTTTIEGASGRGRGVLVRRAHEAKACNRAMFVGSTPIAGVAPRALRTSSRRRDSTVTSRLWSVVNPEGLRSACRTRAASVHRWSNAAWRSSSSSSG